MIKAAQAEGLTHSGGHMKSKNFASVCTGSLYRNRQLAVQKTDAVQSQIEELFCANQDGISQASELFSLADKGIASINPAVTATNTNLNNGNTVGAVATVTRDDGCIQQVQTYTLFAEQVQPVPNAYEQLPQSVYGALVMQTRLRPNLDAVEVVIGGRMLLRLMNLVGEFVLDQASTVRSRC